jgi:hypothetical protein
METRTKFKTLSREELQSLSLEELEAYVSRLKAEYKKLKEEISYFNKKVESDRLKTAEIKGQIKVYQELNQIELRRLGWEDLTEDEIKWLMTDNNFYKEWPYFKPCGSRAIKERYAERMKKPVDDSMDKKFAKDPKMEVSSGWIDREGNYYGVGLAEHSKFASEYLEFKLGREKAEEKIESEHGYADTVLEKQGWVRVMKWPGLDVKFILPKLLSHAQKYTLHTYCEIYKIDFPLEEDKF